MGNYQITITGNYATIKNIRIIFWKKDYDLEYYSYKECKEKFIYRYSEQEFWVSNEYDKERCIFEWTNKHNNYLLKTVEEADISDIKWVENVELTSDNKSAELQNLIDMGEEQYNISLTTTTEDYLTELDYRLSLIELGLV